MIRVLALVPKPWDVSPGQRFRLEQWMPFLQQAGVTIDYRPFESDELASVLYQPSHFFAKASGSLQALLNRGKLVRIAGDYDVVYVFREAALLGPAMFETRLARKKIPFVFDFDDAIFLPNSSQVNRAFSFLKSTKKTDTICRAAGFVMAGNEYLADYARQFNQNVAVVPTTIDTEKYARAPRPPSANPVIGWSGSFTTLAYLKPLDPVLQRLASEMRFSFRVVGTDQYKVDGVNVEALLWRSDTEVKDLQPIDIGVMPLTEDPWSRGKCGLKALQYMALGIPTICSPVGVNSQIIQDGENGMLASTPEEWYSKLKLLLEDPALRLRLGSAGRRTVEKSYSSAVHAPRVLEIFESVARKKREL